jgi:hypothetical protein
MHVDHCLCIVSPGFTESHCGRSIRDAQKIIRCQAWSSLPCLVLLYAIPITYKVFSNLISPANGRLATEVK